MASVISTRMVRGPKGLTVEGIRASLKGRPDYVRVGLPDTQHSGTDLTLAHLGWIHELGWEPGGIPARPFLAPAIVAGKDQIAKLSGALLKKISLKQTTKRGALGLIGELGVRLVQERIASNIPPPLKEETIKRKGSSVALIDTGQLRQSVTYGIEE